MWEVGSGLYGRGSCDVLWDGALSHLHGAQTRIDPAKNRRMYYNRETKKVCSFGREGGSDLAVCLAERPLIYVVLWCRRNGTARKPRARKRRRNLKCAPRARRRRSRWLRKLEERT